MNVQLQGALFYIMHSSGTECTTLQRIALNWICTQFSNYDILLNITGQTSVRILCRVEEKSYEHKSILVEVCIFGVKNSNMQK